MKLHRVPHLSSFILHPSAFLTGGDEGSRTLIVRFTRPTLLHPIELHRQLILVGHITNYFWWPHRQLILVSHIAN